MKKAFLCLALLASSALAAAQNAAPGSVPAATRPDTGNASTARLTPAAGKGSIAGTVVDATTQQPVPFATVALNDPGTSKPLDGTTTDEGGKFTLQKVASGTYQVQVTSIGYGTKTIGPVAVSDSRNQVDLGQVLLPPSVEVLQEVTVQGQRTLIEEKVDRTVYNAEADATNQGGDATDVLRKVPMLSVDLDGNVSMRGSQNIRVLINNRPSTITAGSVADALKQIPSDMIKSVEVITSPSAKYDAEGSGGIINIVTKKNTLEGFALNTDLGVGLRGTNLGLNGSLRKGKMGFSLDGRGRLGYNVNGEFTNRQLTTGSGAQTLTTQQADTRNQFLMGRYSLGWDYDISKHDYLNASVQFGTRNRHTFQDGLLTQTFQDDVRTGGSLRNVNVWDLSNTLDANLNYTHTFRQPQRELSILTQYSRNNATNNFINSLLAEDFSTTSRLKNLNESYNQEVTVELNYQTPLGKNQLLEMGGKEIMRNVTSDYTYFAAEGADGEYVALPGSSRSNVFNYDQHITAGYLSYAVTLPKNYSLKAGTRYEYTTIAARLQTGDGGFRIPSYGVLVPSVNLSKKLENGNTLKAAYNRRIQRPSLQFLNPNVDASNLLNVTTGNPDLRPEYTNNFELAYSTTIKSTSLNFSAFARNTTGAIQRVRDVIPGGVDLVTGLSRPDTIRTGFQNIGSENAYGMSVFANVSLSNRFSLNGGTDVYYAVLDNHVADPLYNASNQGLVYSVRGFANYTLTKGWGLQLFGFYRGREVQLQGMRSGFGVYSLSVKKDLPNKKGSIGFGAENFLTSAITTRSELASPVLTQSGTNTMRNLSFKVNLSYRIGKMTAKDASKRRKSVRNDDLKGGEGNGQEEGTQTGSQPQTPAKGQAPAGTAPGTRPK